MSFRPKRTTIFEKEINVKGSLKGPSVEIYKLEFQNVGKINHKLSGNFSVISQSGKKDLTIKFFILTDAQCLDWAPLTSPYAPRPAFVNLEKSQVLDPPSYLYSSKGALKEGNFELILEKENSLYLVLDNSFSSFTSKNVKLTVYEEWDEKIEAFNVVTSFPPEVYSLRDEIRRMIISATKTLKIITPHMDMEFVQELIEKNKQGIIVRIITRDLGDRGKSASNKQAFDSMQKNLGINHQINTHIHSRLIIVDDVEALVSSADLTHASVLSQYNAGILLSEPHSIQKLDNYFNRIWKDPETTPSKESKGNQK